MCSFARQYGLPGIKLFLTSIDPKLFFRLYWGNFFALYFAEFISII